MFGLSGTEIAVILLIALIALLMFLILRAIRKYNFMFLGTEQG